MKCSICKMNYIERNLIKYKYGCSNKSNTEKAICKSCAKKHDVKEYQSNISNALYKNQLKYNFKKKELKYDEDLINLCCLNAKLKREIKNGN